MGSLGHRDPWDSKDPLTAHWQGFLAGFSANTLLLFLLRDAEASEMIKDHRGFVNAALNRAETIPAEDDPNDWDYDLESVVDLSDYLGAHFKAVRVADAFYLHDRLFPIGLDATNTMGMLRGHSIVGLHSTRETYFKAIAADPGKGPLPDRLRTWLDATHPKASLSATTFLELADLDATRHILVHNRGIVDESYVRRGRPPPARCLRRHGPHETALPPLR